MRYRCLLLAAVLLVAADAPRTDQERIQGTWVCTGMRVDGDLLIWRLYARLYRGTKRSFLGDKYTLGLYEGEGTAEDFERLGTFRLDPTATPKRIDLIAPDRPTELGIYELEGDTLRLCLNTRRRPTRFPGLFRGRAQGIVYSYRRERPSASRSGRPSASAPRASASTGASAGTGSSPP
jgi:uncharacterized protein (TIGR03067 family)